MKRLRVSDAASSHSWGMMLPLQERFGAMIARLEIAASRNAAGYRRRVAAAGFLGYAVLALVVALLLGLILFMVAVVFASGHAAGAAAVLGKAALILGLIAFSILRALWVRRPEPSGERIERDDYPALFAMVEQVRALAQGPTVHEIRLTDDFNAAVTQEPRVLVFGSYNILYLGLPLLLALPKDEVAAVVAHEFGHFVGRHGRTAGFVYRVRLRWAQLAARLSSLTPEEGLDHAMLVEEIDGTAAAIPAYEALLVADPDNLGARFHLGHCLLSERDENGIAHLEQLTAPHGLMAVIAGQRILEHLVAHERDEQAAQWRAWLDAAFEKQRLASEAAVVIDAGVTLMPLDLPADELVALRDALASVAGLRELHAACRHVDHHDKPQIVFVFTALAGFDARSLLDALLDIVLNYRDAMGLEVSRDRRWLVKKVKAVPESQLFP